MSRNAPGGGDEKQNGDDSPLPNHTEYDPELDAAAAAAAAFEFMEVDAQKQTMPNRADDKMQPVASTDPPKAQKRKADESSASSGSPFEPFHWSTLATSHAAAAAASADPMWCIGAGSLAEHPPLPLYPALTALPEADDHSKGSSESSGDESRPGSAQKPNRKKKKQAREDAIPREARPKHDIFVHMLTAAGPGKGAALLKRLFLLCGMCEDPDHQKQLIGFIVKLCRDDFVKWLNRLGEAGGLLHTAKKGFSKLISSLKTRCAQEGKTCLHEKLKANLKFAEVAGDKWVQVLTKDPLWEGCIKRELILHIQEFSSAEIVYPEDIRVLAQKAQKMYSKEFFDNFVHVYLTLSDTGPTKRPRTEATEASGPAIGAEASVPLLAKGNCVIFYPDKAGKRQSYQMASEELLTLSPTQLIQKVTPWATASKFQPALFPVELAPNKPAFAPNLIKSNRPLSGHLEVMMQMRAEADVGPATWQEEPESDVKDDGADPAAFRLAFSDSEDEYDQSSSDEDSDSLDLVELLREQVASLTARLIAKDEHNASLTEENAMLKAQLELLTRDDAPPIEESASSSLVKVAPEVGSLDTTAETIVDKPPESSDILERLSSLEITEPSLPSEEVVRKTSAQDIEILLSKLPFTDDGSPLQDILETISTVMGGELGKGADDALAQSKPPATWPNQLWEIAMALSVARGLITAVENLSVGVERPTNRILDHENRTALHWAAKTGRETSVVHLIEHGAEIEAKNKFFHTALHTAAREGFDTVVDTLLTRGANKDAIDENFHTPLYRAAKGGHHSCVEVLLKKKASLSIADNLGRTAVHVAALHGRLRVINVAATSSEQFHVVLNSTCHRGKSPLHYAAIAGHLLVGERLIKLGANIACQDILNRTPFQLAISHNHVETAEMFFRFESTPMVKLNPQILETPAGGRALHMAAIKGHVEPAKLLLRHEVNIDELDAEMKTPLHHAALSGKLEMVELLTAAGANTSLRDNGNERAVDLAAIDISHALQRGLGERAKRSLEDILKPVYHDLGEVLYDAAERNDLAKVQELLDLGVDPDAYTDPRNGWTATHRSIMKGHMQILLCLVKKGKASLISRDFDGDTPLHLAAAYGRMESAVILAEVGADESITNYSGKTVLEWAREYSIPVDQVRDAILKGRSKQTEATAIVSELEPVTPTQRVTSDKDEALYDAASDGNLDEMARLFANNADPNGFSDPKTGWSPLHRASMRMRLDVAMRLQVVKALVDNSSDPIKTLHARDKDGDTPMHIAAVHGHSAYVEELVALGGDPLLTNADSATVVQAARRSDHGRVIEEAIERGRQRRLADKTRRSDLPRWMSGYADGYNDPTVYQ